MWAAICNVRRIRPVSLVGRFSFSSWLLTASMGRIVLIYEKNPPGKGSQTLFGENNPPGRACGAVFAQTCGAASARG